MRLAWALVLSLCACGPRASSDVTVAVEKGALAFAQSFQGELVATKSVPVHAPKVPRVDTVTIRTVLADGTPVKKGDVVATLDTTEVEENVRVARVELEIAVAERKKTEQGLVTERVSLELEQKKREMAVEEAKLKLVEGVNLISELERKKADVNLRAAQVELELAKSAFTAFDKKKSTTMDVADIRVKSAEKTLAEHSTALERFDLRAPADGVVYRPYVQLNYTRAKAEPGRVCRPGDKVVELPDLSAFEVTLQVRPRDAARMKVGDAVRVFVVALNGREIAAKVARKDEFATTRNERYGTKTPEGNLKQIAVTLELAEQPAGMKPGGTVRAELKSVLAPDAVLVPVWALEDERDGRAFVRLASGERREIEIGLASATHAEVLKGLAGGETLVVPKPAASTSATPPP